MELTGGFQLGNLDTNDTVVVASQESLLLEWVFKV